MKIIAHRGLWTSVSEQNSEQAFERAFLAGFGIEFDIRDHNQSLVVSHDMPSGAPMPLARLLEMHAELAPEVPLAINIKADGLADELKLLTEQYRTGSFFAFDMSVPDMIHYLRLGLPCLARCSEFEPFTVLHAQAQGVWFDCFTHLLPDNIAIQECMDQGQIACVVSAELHDQGHHAQWAMLKQLSAMYLPSSPYLMLCTDEPHAAKEEFNA